MAVVQFSWVIFGYLGVAWGFRLGISLIAISSSPQLMNNLLPNFSVDVAVLLSIVILLMI